MSEKNVDIVRRALEAWSERDQDAIDALFHPDFEYHGLAEWPGLERAFRGRRETLRRASSIDADFDEFHGRPLELIEVGQRVVCVLEVTAIGKQSRVPVRFTETALITVRDRRLVRIEVCESVAAAVDLGARPE